MSTTIDHLRVDHQITVLQDFVDSLGVSRRAGDTGVLRKLAFDQLKELILMEIEGEVGVTSLTFTLRAQNGPRNGHMREFFEIGEDVSVPPVESSGTVLESAEVEGPDRLVEMENAMRQKYDHIGVAVSIAEAYAERMRLFRQLGNEPRAIAAFKLAAEWMDTYASWATSGGEGAANSYERDRFCEALVAEFGYDPTAR